MLGVAKPSRTTVAILLSPVGPYFPSGLKPISLFVDEHNRRAWPGGAGDCKLGGNYAPTIQPQVGAGLLGWPGAGWMRGRGLLMEVVGECGLGRSRSHSSSGHCWHPTAWPALDRA